MLKATLLLYLAMLCAGIGNICLGKGMRMVGPLDDYRITPFVKYVLSAITNYYVILGVLVSIGYFFLWMVVLSWAEVSWALPMNAVEYVFVTFAAIIVLRERVNKGRWLGLGFIAIGTCFLMTSW